MNYLAIFTACVGMFAASACLADDTDFCKSMCESRHGECRAEARPAGNERLLAQSDTHHRNPLARTAAGEVPGQGSRALGAAGETYRRLDRTGACDKTYQQCERSCVAGSDLHKRMPEPKLSGK